MQKGRPQSGDCRAAFRDQNLFALKTPLKPRYRDPITGRPRVVFTFGRRPGIYSWCGLAATTISRCLRSVDLGEQATSTLRRAPSPSDRRGIDRYYLGDVNDWHNLDVVPGVVL